MINRSFFSARFPAFLLAFLMVLSATMMGFSSGGFILNFKQIGFNVLSVGQMGVGVVTSGIRNSVEEIQAFFNLKKRYDELEEKLKDFESMQRRYSELFDENTRLREQLDFSRAQENKNYPASIISRGTDGYSMDFIINKGSRHGIKRDMPVIAVKGGSQGVVGKVTLVGAVTAQVMPLYASKSNISARIQKTRDIGLVEGSGSSDSQLQLKYIKKDIKPELSIGDLVVTSGENGNYPPDIQIGSIEDINDFAYDNSLQIAIKPIVDFSRLETVIVVDTFPNDAVVEMQE